MCEREREGESGGGREREKRRKREAMCELRIQVQINKWDLIKLKSFCTVKEAINKMKKDSPQNGRKYLQMKQ